MGLMLGMTEDRQPKVLRLTGDGELAEALGARLVAGEKTVTTAGTPEALAASQTVLRGVTVRAKASNTDSILVGPQADPVFPLEPGEAVVLYVGNLDDVWLDAATSGDGVSYLAEVG